MNTLFRSLYRSHVNINKIFIKFEVMYFFYNICHLVKMEGVVMRILQDDGM